MKRTALASAMALAFAPVAVARDYDLVVRNARVVDGTGSPWFRADVAVKGDTIVAVGRGLPGTAQRVVDAGDRVIAPGFIDIHTHAGGIHRLPAAENFVRQGVTTLVDGPDGESQVPLGDSLARVEALPPGVNYASFVGHGSVRESVLGRANRAPSAEELRRMEGLVETAMKEGAFGLSTGLFYVPGTFARPDEVVALARVAGRLGGIHISHMRDEAAGVLDAVKETITIGEEGQLPTQISHHKLIGRPVWGRSADTLRLVEEARARGVDVTIDQYPYDASFNSLWGPLFPPWVLEGNREESLKRLADPVKRERVQEAVRDRLRDAQGGGDPRRVRIRRCDFDAALVGRTLAEVLESRGLEPTVDNAAPLVIELFERGVVTATFHAIADEDLERILAFPLTMVASDAGIPAFGLGTPHPRTYGSFARVLGLYVREKGLISLEDAIRKMTSLPAARLGLVDRGLLRRGMKADLVVLDPATVRDRATFEDPHQHAEGVSLVLVNGAIVLDDGHMTGARPGRVLRGPAYVPPDRPSNGGPE